MLKKSTGNIYSLVSSVVCMVTCLITVPLTEGCMNQIPYKVCISLPFLAVTKYAVLIKSLDVSLFVLLFTSSLENKT